MSAESRTPSEVIEGCLHIPVGPPYRQAMARVILAAFAEAGYVVVPVEPTEAMLSAAYDGGADMHEDGVAEVWRAMVKAARE